MGCEMDMSKEIRPTVAEKSFMLEQAIRQSFNEKRFEDAFRFFVSTYFEVYEDATELDSKTYFALEHLWDMSCLYEGNLEFENIVNKEDVR